MPSPCHRGRPDRLAISVLLLILALGLIGGCAPQNIGRYNEIAFGDTRRVRNTIIETFDDWYADVGYWVQGDIEPVEDFPGPTAVDLRPPEGDYVLGPGDIVQITIQELFAQGVPWVQTVRIGEEGTVSLPVSYLRDIRAEGYTARGFERRLVERLTPPDGPLRDPRVSVFVVEVRNRNYAIRGTNRPGIYQIMSHDMTLFEAIANSGDVNPFHEEFGYVVRRMSQEELAELLLMAWADYEAETGEGDTNGSAGDANSTGNGAAMAPDADNGQAAVDSEAGPAEVMATRSGNADAPARSSADMPSMTDIEELQAVAEGRKPNVVVDGPAPPIMQPMAEPTELVAPEPPPSMAAEGASGWVFDEEKGIWVETAPGAAPRPATPSVDDVREAAEDGELPELYDDIEKLPPALRERLARLGVVQAGDGLRRIIRFHVGALLAGDQTQNVVMRHGDLVNIPEPPAGEWYIDGEIVRRGVYSLTGRKITVLQAVAAAGGLTQLAIPWRTELVRRVGESNEEIIYVDVAKIARGEAPDFFLQPNDLIRVGTDQGATFLAVFRNAFRATYGFGLVYDQNFADLYPWTGDVHPLF